uniref:Peptidase S54 rhomboid domain-containing protein n=1 Tax=Panagrolaimus sp. ES5 TaxID=591445 RepID=A0AC34F575_9BILA
MFRFVYAKSTFKVLGSRLLTHTTKFSSRFTREGLRDRLRNSSNNNAPIPKQQSINAQHPTFRPDSIPVRPVKDLWKALGFTAVLGSSLFTAAIIVEYERNRFRVRHLFNDFTDAFFKTQQTQQIHLSDGQKWALGIIGLNTLVFLMWKVPALERVMWQFFTNSYASKSLCSPMLLSVFSHYSFLHLALNMYVLFNFVPLSINKFLGVEQFTAFYLTAGVVSSLASVAHKAVIGSPIRALGASGAILGALCYVCMKIPDAKLNIVFLPMWTFPAQSAVIGLVLFDLAGLLLRFRIFDHAAHLGGALFGVFYALYGEKFMSEKVYPTVLSGYRQIRRIARPPPPSLP